MKLTMRIWHCVQAAERPCREPANVQGSLREWQARATTPPAQQRMPQQPLQVVALGVPLQHHAREPALGLPNNVFYPGHAVGTSL